MALVQTRRAFLQSLLSGAAGIVVAEPVLEAVERALWVPKVQVVVPPPTARLIIGRDSGGFFPAEGLTTVGVDNGKTAFYEFYLNGLWDVDGEIVRDVRKWVR